MKTKLLTILILTLCFAASGVSAQDGKDVVSIRGEVAAINKAAKKYKKKTKDVEGISLEGAEATFYSSGKDLKKVMATMYGETYFATGEFYYKGEELIFAFVTYNRYDTQVGLDKPPKVVSKEEKRLYFVDGKLTKLLIGKANIKSSDERFTSSEEETVDISSKLRAAF